MRNEIADNKKTKGSCAHFTFLFMPFTVYYERFACLGSYEFDQGEASDVHERRFCVSFKLAFYWHCSYLVYFKVERFCQSTAN